MPRLSHVTLAPYAKGDGCDNSQLVWGPIMYQESEQGGMQVKLSKGKLDEMAMGE